MIYGWQMEEYCREIEEVDRSLNKRGNIRKLYRSPATSGGDGTHKGLREVVYPRDLRKDNEDREKVLARQAKK